MCVLQTELTGYVLCVCSSEAIKMLCIVRVFFRNNSEATYGVCVLQKQLTGYVWCACSSKTIKRLRIVRVLFRNKLNKTIKSLSDPKIKSNTCSKTMSLSSNDKSDIVFIGVMYEVMQNRIIQNLGDH